MNKNLLLMLAFASVLCLGCGTSCTSTGNGTGVKPLEQMTELEYSKWQLYIQLGVKIGANRLVQEKIVTADQLNIAANVIDAVKTEPITGGATSIITPALQKAGFKNDEVQLVLLIAEQELVARGALNWVNPQTGVLELSPRTKDMLGVIASALRTAPTATEADKNAATKMKADFSQQ